jgi:hypothetical protein
MDPRREKPKAAKPRPEKKPKRFRIVKLEERITPKHMRSGSGCGNSDLSNGCYGSIE